MNESDSLYVFSYPSIGRVNLPLICYLGSSLFPYQGFPFCDSISIYLITGKGTYRVSQVLVISLLTYHALRWTPTDPYHSYHTDWFVLASVGWKTSPSVFNCVTELYQASGMYDYPLWSIGFSVYASCLSFCDIIYSLPTSTQHSIRVVG